MTVDIASGLVFEEHTMESADMKFMIVYLGSVSLAFFKLLDRGLIRLNMIEL